MSQKLPQMEIKKSDSFCIYYKEKCSEGAESDRWISCRKCAKWAQENCTAALRMPSTILSATLVKKNSMKLILKQKCLYPLVPHFSTYAKKTVFYTLKGFQLYFF
jgi:hypothetical protein